jgi:uncharacterized protein YndB with AHSA1/START domain
VEITRVFNYPRDAVFRMWTDQRRVAKWWGPEGCTVVVCEVDPREGGTMKIDTQNPDGSVYPMTGTFTKVAAPELLVFRSAGPGPGGQFGDSPWTCLNRVTFEELSPSKTRVTVAVKVVMAAPKVIDALEQGFKGGWAESFQRLQEALG